MHVCLFKAGLVIIQSLMNFYEVSNNLNQNVLRLTWHLHNNTLEVAQGEKIPKETGDWKFTNSTFLLVIASALTP